MVSNKPLVSVVLPTHNRAQLLPRAIRSVLCQSYKNLELVVVDDGSSEDIRSVTESFNDPRIRYVRRENRGGVAAARNSGVAHATGSLLAFQDSDDEWMLEKLEEQVSLLSSHQSERCMVICGLLRVNNLGARRYPGYGLDPVRCLSIYDVLSTPVAYTQTWLVSRECILGVGGFDERLGIWDDWELLIRLAKVSKVYVLQRPLVISEATSDSLSKVNPPWSSDMAIVLDKHADTLQQLPEQDAILHYLLGRQLNIQNNRQQARRALLYSIRRNSRYLKTWLMLFSTFLGPWFVNRVLKA